MVTVAYNTYCVISMEGDDDTYDGKLVVRPRGVAVERSELP